MPISPIKNRAKKYVGIYLAIILFIISFGLGVLIGRAWHVKKQITGENGEVQIAKVLNLNRATSRAGVEFSQFWEVWDKIKAKYVKQPVKDADMFYGAIQGLVMALGDPYSLYLPPQAAEEFAKDLSGELEGIGAEIGVKDGQLVVVAPLPDSPAEKSGLRPGDKILFIDKESTFGLDVITAVGKIRGQAGTKVTLTIARNGLTKSTEVEIVREKINVPSILFSVKPNNIGYLRVMQFNDETTRQLAKYIRQMRAKNVGGVILDLRNNPGGYMDAAVEMASEWIRDGVVVSEKGVDGLNNNHFTAGRHALAEMPTVVLINKGSASASEIVAGALQDYKKAILLGEKTFGKGSVQDFETFSDGSALKLTVAEWFTPQGRNINKEGVAPDIEIKEDWEKEKIGEDIVLEQALALFVSSTFQW